MTYPTYPMNGKRVMFVPTSSTANHFRIEGDMVLYFDMEDGIEQSQLFFLRPGNDYQYIGLSDSEEAAKEVVEGWDVATGGDDYQDYYKNYSDYDNECEAEHFTEPLKSLSSFLKSKQLEGRYVMIEIK